MHNRVRARPSGLSHAYAHTISTNLTSINLHINASIRLRVHTHRIENFNVDAFAQEHFADPKQRTFVSHSPNLRTDHRSEYYVKKNEGRPTNLAAHIVPVSLLARASILAPVVDQV